MPHFLHNQGTSAKNAAVPRRATRSIPQRRASLIATGQGGSMYSVDGPVGGSDARSGRVRSGINILNAPAIFVIIVAALVVLASASRSAPQPVYPVGAAEQIRTPGVLATPYQASTRFRGTATWYCSAQSACTRGYRPSDLVAAIDTGLPFRHGDRVTVRADGRAVTVTIVDTCACAGGRIIDLTYGAFSRLADPSVGMITVTLEAAGQARPRPAPTGPATDTD